MTDQYEGTPPDADNPDMADEADAAFDDVDTDDGEQPLADDELVSDDEPVDDDLELANPPDGDEGRTTPEAPDDEAQ